MQAVLPIILDGLTNASQASSAALAFRDVCGECAEHLAPVVMQIIPACQVITYSCDVYIYMYICMAYMYIVTQQALPRLLMYGSSARLVSSNVAIHLRLQMVAMY